jgi:hypothetical protein
LTVITWRALPSETGTGKWNVVARGVAEGVRLVAADGGAGFGTLRRALAEGVVEGVAEGVVVGVVVGERLVDDAVTAAGPASAGPCAGRVATQAAAGRASTATTAVAASPCLLVRRIRPPDRPS